MTEESDALYRVNDVLSELNAEMGHADDDVLNELTHHVARTLGIVDDEPTGGLTTEAVLRGLVDAMTDEAADLQRQAHVAPAMSSRGGRLAEKAAGVRKARTLVEEALRGIPA